MTKRKIDAKPEATYTDSKLLYSLLCMCGGAKEIPKDFLDSLPSFANIVWIERKKDAIVLRAEESEKIQIEQFRDTHAWPEDDRMNVIGRNGNDGDHYKLNKDNKNA